MSGTPSIQCPQCGAANPEDGIVCWKCSALIEQAESTETTQTQPQDTLRDFTAEIVLPRPPEPRRGFKRLLVTLTGEQVEAPEPAEASEQPAAQLPLTLGDAAPPEAVPPGMMRLLYCKHCGLQNDEAAVECRRCRRPLEVVEAGSVGDITPLRRAWGFDLLGLAWVVLGVSAIVAGRFLIKASPAHAGVTWSDYFWTGVVACAPGVLIFMRHFFCRVLFWVMTLASALIWSLLGAMWILGYLHVTDNGQIGLIWLGALSGLGAISWFVVRVNDAFDPDR